MAKHFIKIQYRKKPANLLEEQVQRAILELDQTLWPTLDQAKFMVYQKFDDAVLAYRGRCKMQRPTGSDHDVGMHIIYADVCNVSIYIAKRDFTLGAHGEPTITVRDATPEEISRAKKILNQPVPREASKHHAGG
jgi:hypothetical protein